MLEINNIKLKTNICFCTHCYVQIILDESVYNLFFELKSWPIHEWF